MRNARASLDSVAETEEIGATKIIRRSTSERVLAWLRIKAQRARRLAAFAGAGVALLVVAVLWVGMARVREAERSTRLAEAKLDEVLREQAALASQWQTFRGIQTRDLAELRAQIQSAPDIDSRRVAVDRLLVGVADTLGPLAATGDDTLGEGQVGLRYEVVGAENRVNVEGRRFDEARTRWRSAAATLPGALAVTLGLARMPPHPQGRLADLRRAVAWLDAVDRENGPIWEQPIAVTAARVYRALALRVLAAKKSKVYGAALQNLADARRCSLAAGQGRLWDAVVAEVRAAHARKTSFIKDFERIAAGAGPTTEPSFLERARGRWFSGSSG